MARFSTVSAQNRASFKEYGHIPECLQALDGSMLADDNLALAEFLCVAIPASLGAVNGDPFGADAVKPVVRGVELVLNLLADRLAMAAGKSFVPTCAQLNRAGAD